MIFFTISGQSYSVLADTLEYVFKTQILLDFGAIVGRKGIILGLAIVLIEPISSSFLLLRKIGHFHLLGGLKICTQRLLYRIIELSLNHREFPELNQLFLLILLQVNKFLLTCSQQLINKSLYLRFKLTILGRRTYFKVDGHHSIRDLYFSIDLMHSFIYYVYLEVYLDFICYFLGEIIVQSLEKTDDVRKGIFLDKTF